MGCVSCLSLLDWWFFPREMQLQEKKAQENERQLKASMEEEEKLHRQCLSPFVSHSSPSPIQFPVPPSVCERRYHDARGKIMSACSGIRTQKALCREHCYRGSCGRCGQYAGDCEWDMLASRLFMSLLRYHSCTAFLGISKGAGCFVPTLV